VLVVFSLIARVSAAPSAAEYVDQAVKLYNQGNCTKAVEVLKKAIAVNPSYARAYSWLGLCYARMGRTQEAIAAFKKVIALAPKSEDARIAQQWIAKLQQSVAQQPPASPVAPRVTAAAPVFLVDLPAATGVAEANRPRQVQLFGQTYRKAIAERRSWGRTWGGNPEWRIVYNVGRRYARFRVLAGVADGERPDFTAVFEVRGDGNTLHESKPKRAGDIPENLDLDITGVLQLELLVRGPEQYDQATVVWADPRVLPPGAVSGAAPGATAPPPSPAPAPAPPAPPVLGSQPAPPPAAALKGVVVMPFADSSGTYREAGTRVVNAITEELFKLGKTETVSQQRLAQATAGIRPDPLDAGAARQVAQKVGARLMVLGIVERFHIQTGTSELIIRIVYKDVFITVSFQVIDVANGERVLADTARVGLRSTAAQSYQLPSDEDMLRAATRQAAAEIAQKVALAWAQRSGELTFQLTQAILARNVQRDADFRLVPVGVATTFPSSSTQIVVYLSASGAKSGQRIDLIWYSAEGKEYARGTVVVPADQPTDQPFVAHHVIRPLAGSMFSPGKWTVQIRVEGFLFKTLTFTVTEG